MTLNIEKLTELRDFIAGLPPEKLDMSEYRRGHGCNTAGCVLGWTLMREAKRQKKSYSALVATRWPADVGRDLLGLNESQAQELFYPSRWQSRQFTPAQAAAAIDSLIKTGEVTWPENTP